MYAEWLIANRFIRGVIPAAFFSAKSRISFLVMVISIALLVVVISVFNGFQAQMKRSIWEQGSQINLFPLRHNGISYNYKEQIERIKKLPLAPVPLKNPDDMLKAPRAESLITDIHGAISSPGLLARGNEFIPIELRAVEVRRDENGNLGREFPRLVRYDRNLLDKLDQGNYILIGEEMARYNGLLVGETIKLYVARGGTAKKGGEFATRYFVIAGTFKTNYLETDSTVVYLSLGIGQSFYSIPGGVTKINISVETVQDLHRLVPVLEREMTDFNISNVERRQKNLLAALQLEKTLISIILFMFIVLAAVGMVATIYSQVRAKRQSLGILKALGLSPGSLLFIFTGNGLLLGMIASIMGGVAGIALALVLEKIIYGVEYGINRVGEMMEGPYWSKVHLIPREIYYFDSLPVNIDLYLILLVTFSATLLSGIAGYFPARKAASLDPVETIRYE